MKSEATQKRSSVDSPFDVCECGDYRKSHENGTGKCAVCSAVHALWDNCTHFLFSHVEGNEGA